VETNGANQLRISNDFFYAIAESIEYPKKITIEQIRNCDDFKNISEEMANEIIDGLYKLSIITYKIYKENEFRNV
jgi:hypothetical protein